MSKAVFPAANQTRPVHGWDPFPPSPMTIRSLLGYRPMYQRRLSRQPDSLRKGRLIDDSRFWSQSACMLEYTLGTGVMDESISADEPFLHQNLAPGAEAVGQFNSRCVWKSSHVNVLFLSVATLSTDCEQLPAQGRNIPGRHVRIEKTWYSSRSGQSKCPTLLQKGNDFL